MARFYMRKAQVATEYLVMFAFLLLIVGIFFAYSFMTASDAVAIHKIRDSLLRISSASENIASLGEGSRTTVYIELPDNIGVFEARESYVRINAYVGGGYSDFAEIADVSFSPVELPKGKGPYRLLLVVQDGNVVISQV